MKHYLLDENKVPYEVSIEEAYKVYEDLDMKIVKRDETSGGLISTVFLGLDHAFGDQEGPILFETMIFDGEFDGFQRRYKTYDEALQGHNEALNMVIDSFNIKNL